MFLEPDDKLIDGNGAQRNCRPMQRLVMCAPCAGSGNLFRLSLFCNSSYCLLERILIRKVVMTYRLKIRIKLVNQRNTRRNIEFNDFFLRDLVQILDECPKAVAMCNDEKPLSCSFLDFITIKSC